MERHSCKLCTRTFANGRALGGHMKAHLATLPLPPKTHQQLTELASSSSSSSGGEEEEQREDKNMGIEEKSLVYGLRENPKKSFRFADPEFSFAAAAAAVDSGSVVVQDRESETESRNPTRRRSKRNRVLNVRDNIGIIKPKLKKPSWVDSQAEPEPVSSVSDSSPEEDVAMCLMMLSRDVWMRNNDEQVEEDNEILVEGSEAKIKVSKFRGKNRCDKCNKVFRSSQALGSHRRICFEGAKVVIGTNERIFECPFCCKVFGSGQALGGHKRSHLLAASSTSAAAAAAVVAATALATSSKIYNNLIDLNLPAPLEDDQFSVVSDA
ncbi:zf-C2H2_6 domain-containing protein [Cephalotus follicularis]|uniref:Zf-C2H2_6 domain-containing protein n=1 Tax=Cephalotus follicularis TaxID=3775 RepID=A0A1Q3CXZ8_CEPFO|nr:zf-C2H2_6 domain-containing protein [Cephalotus follicularis]